MSSEQVEYELGAVDGFADSNAVAFHYLFLSRVNPLLRTSHSVHSLVDDISHLLFFQDTLYVVVTGRDEPPVLSCSPSIYTFEGYSFYKGVRQWTALFDGNTFYLSLERDCFIQTTKERLEHLVVSLSKLISTKHSTDLVPFHLN